MDEMTDSSADEKWPLPIIDPKRCNGCGLCVKACPTGTLAMLGAVAVVAHPEACEYTGDCERICPVAAITRPFQVMFDLENEIGPAPGLAHDQAREGDSE